MTEAELLASVKPAPPFEETKKTGPSHPILLLLSSTAPPNLMPERLSYDARAQSGHRPCSRVTLP
jgi:hypothetical protein